MRIGELAAQAGVSTDTVRFYEKVGLVAGRRLPNGYRDFPPETVAWLHYIRTAQTLGFSLAEISRNCARLRTASDTSATLSALFQEKITLIDDRIAELAALRDDLTARVDSGCPLRPAGPRLARHGTERPVVGRIEVPDE